MGLRDPWTFRSVGESSGVDEATVNGVRDITDHQAHEPNSSDIVGQTFSDLVDANDRSLFHKTLATVGPLARIEYARTAPTTASFSSRSALTTCRTTSSHTVWPRCGSYGTGSGG